jgi:hypothetical protein
MSMRVLQRLIVRKILSTYITLLITPFSCKSLLRRTQVFLNHLTELSRERVSAALTVFSGC